MAKAIGVDIGGTNLRIGVFSGLTLLEETRFQANFSQICKDHSPALAWKTILQVSAESIQTVMRKHSEAETVGMGFPGFIEPASAIIAQSPNLPGLKNVNLAKDLTQLLGKKVVVENDANAAAFGEYCLAGQPQGGFVYLGLGTGVGGGFVLDGKPFVGRHGCAMEAGHIIVKHLGRACGCGNHGCVEQYASASGVAISYQKATSKQLTAAEIAALAHQGDADALAAYHLAAETLAQALASILKVLDAPNVVIGGGMAAAWPLMQARFEQRLQHDLIPVLRGKVNVSVSDAHDVAGMLGAAMLGAATSA